MIVAGLDLARRSDHSALVRLRSTVRWGWEVTHALRLPQIAYRAQLEALRPALAGVERLAVDAGGVGDPVMEMLDGELPEGPRLLPVLITGGESARIGDDGRWRAPKSLLVSALRGAMGMGRLTVAPNAVGSDDLRSEMTKST